MHRVRSRHVAIASLCAALAACSGDGGPESRLSGLLLDGQLAETSGLAASRSHRNTLWLVEDGGNPAQLHAVSRRGRRRASVTIEGVHNTDWEDLAAFELDGKRYLLVADTGDNGGLRRTLLLHVIAEPARLRDGATLKPAWSIAFRWPDGARDCEAVAVDAARGQILLLSKKRRPPELFALPLRPGNKALQEARLLARLDGFPAGDARSDGERLQDQVSAADVSPDGRTLAVLRYGGLLLYRRGPAQDWGEAVSAAPRRRDVPWLHQPEALGWAADGSGLYASGEFSPAPLVFLPVDR
jgi:hypothetical protein